jgi:hypothetical protein
MAVMGIFRILGRGLRRLFIFAAAAIWLIGAAALTFSMVGQVSGDSDVNALAMRIAIGIGLPMLLVGSVIVLRLSGRERVAQLGMVERWHVPWCRVLLGRGAARATATARVSRCVLS